jgi:hypothetical protein
MRSIFLALTLVSALVAGPLWAQDGQEQAGAMKRRNDCRLAGQIVQTGQPHTRKEWAETFITVCPAEGPPIFAERWTTVPADTGAVGTLLHQSARLRDARIYAQLLRTVQDRTRPSVVRVGAMLVLARYVDPYHAPWFNDVAPPREPIRHIRLPLGSALHPGVILGESPLPESLHAQVLGTLDAIAEAQQIEPPAVWYAAAALAKKMRL